MNTIYEGAALRSNDTAVVAWGIVAGHTYSASERKWYHVARLAKVDGAWFETYWYVGALRGRNQLRIRAMARSEGITLERGVFSPAQNRNGLRLDWSEDRA